MDNQMLRVENVTKKFPGRVAVKNISFQVNKGSIHGFLGPNGAGKTTTMRMITGLLPLSSGSIFLEQEHVHPLNQKIKNMIGFLPENAPLYLDMTVGHYLEFVGRIHRCKQIHQKRDQVLEDLKLNDVKNRLIGNLSKGFRQRVALASVLIYDPPFLVLDEPTSGLDPQTKVELRELIKNLSLRKTILFSSHILSEVESLCDDVTIIGQGEIKASGPLSEMRENLKMGQVIRLGIREQDLLPSLPHSEFGKYHIINEKKWGIEKQFEIVFENQDEIRPALGRFLFQQGIDILTLELELPELENIFLRLTETVANNENFNLSKQV